MGAVLSRWALPSTWKEGVLKVCYCETEHTAPVPALSFEENVANVWDQVRGVFLPQSQAQFH